MANQEHKSPSLYPQNLTEMVSLVGSSAAAAAKIIAFNHAVLLVVAVYGASRLFSRLLKRGGGHGGHH